MLSYGTHEIPQPALPVRPIADELIDLKKEISLLKDRIDIPSAPFVTCGWSIAD
jgi:hypothetical protein